MLSVVFNIIKYNIKTLVQLTHNNIKCKTFFIVAHLFTFVSSFKCGDYCEKESKKRKKKI